MIGKAGKSLQAIQSLVKAAVSAAFKKRIGHFNRCEWL